jgi:hypothetical protein
MILFPGYSGFPKVAPLSVELPKYIIGVLCLAAYCTNLPALTFMTISLRIMGGQPMWPNAFPVQRTLVQGETNKREWKQGDITRGGTGWVNSLR